MVANLLATDMFYRREPGGQEEPDRRQERVWLRAGIRLSRF